MMGDESATENGGPPLSKNALKKLLKKEAAEKKKAERAIARVSWWFYVRHIFSAYVVSDYVAVVCRIHHSTHINFLLLHYACHSND